MDKKGQEFATKEAFLNDHGQDWRELAACRDVEDPNIFFPTEDVGNKTIEVFNRYCVDCAVRNECLGYDVTRHGAQEPAI